MKTITKHYIDRAFVDSHGHEVMEIVKPTNGEVVVRVSSALLSGSPTNWAAILTMAIQILNKKRISRRAIYYG
jgi:hypothetical protein